MTNILKHLFLFLILTFNVFAYNRDKYGGLSKNPYTGCNTRQEILLTQYVKVYEKVSKCKISGLWIDFYTGELLLDWSKIDIDHVLPVSYYDKHCRKDKTLQEIRKFYNDTENLVITSKKENQRKGNKTKEKYAYMIIDEERRKDYIKKYNAVYKKYCE